MAQEAPRDAIFVKESTSTTAMVFDHLDLTLPGSYYFPPRAGSASGCLPPSARSSPSPGGGWSRWSATAPPTTASPRCGRRRSTGVPVVFVILNNGTYGALRWFVNDMGVSGTPGHRHPRDRLRRPGTGVRVSARRVSDVGQLREALAEALASDVPTLIEVPTHTDRPVGAVS